MGIKFNYENVGKSFFGEIFRPIAKVSFKLPKSNLWIDTWMIVDTGADFTILPRYLSDDLKISLEHDCVKDFTSGVGGDQTTYLYKSKLKARIGDLDRTVPIAFLDSNEVPPLIGRLGFLETFNTGFLKNHTVVFKD